MLTVTRFSFWCEMPLKSFGSKHKKEASDLLLEGVAAKDVAARFGVHVSTIYGLRKTMGHGHTKPDRASRVLNLRLSDEEFRALDAFVADAGLPTRSAAMRSLIRAATGFLELRREEFMDLSDAKTELKAQGRNLNQLTFALNKAALKGGVRLSEADRTFLLEVKRAYAALDTRLSGAFREVRQKGRDALHTGERV